MATLKEALSRFRSAIERHVARDPSVRVGAVDASLAEDGIYVLVYADLSNGDTEVSSFALAPAERFDQHMRDRLEAAFSSAAMAVLAALTPRPVVRHKRARLAGLKLAP